MLAVLYSEQSLGLGGRPDAMLGEAVATLLERAAPRDDGDGSEEGADEGGGDGGGEGGGDAAGAWLGRVHALNLLRNLFQDRAFGVVIQPFLARGFLRAFEGLSSPRWAVRNSALLLLASLLERALRNRRSRDEHAAANALGVRDFFARAPELHPFLLRQLRACAVHGRAGGGGGGGGEAVLQPDTFAILLLLSKLVPSATAQEGTADSLDLGAFVPLVRACDAPPSNRPACHGL